jgi:hypothetical protein
LFSALAVVRTVRAAAKNKTSFKEKKHDHSNLFRSRHFLRALHTHHRDRSGRTAQSVKAEIDSKKVVITFDAPADEQKIKALLAEINYPAEGLITL